MAKERHGFGGRAEEGEGGKEEAEQRKDQTLLELEGEGSDWEEDGKSDEE